MERYWGLYFDEDIIFREYRDTHWKEIMKEEINENRTSSCLEVGGIQKIEVGVDKEVFSV